MDLRARLKQPQPENPIAPTPVAKSNNVRLSPGAVGQRTSIEVAFAPQADVCNLEVAFPYTHQRRSRLGPFELRPDDGERMWRGDTMAVVMGTPIEANPHVPATLVEAT
jgi:hypothetical protein